MGATIKFQSPYEIRIGAGDLASGHPVSNVIYLSNAQGVAVVAYGSPIPGGGDTATLLANFRTLFETWIVPLLSVNYKALSYTMRRIVGWKYGTPLVPIATMGVGIPTVVQTSTPITFPTGSLISISGVGGATAANGTWVATVTGPNTLTISANTTGQVFSGGGVLQLAAGTPGFSYDDLEGMTVATLGGIAGEAIPLFSDVSVRRLGSRAGKSWQGRNSYAPIGESQNVNGRLSTAAKALWDTAVAAMSAGPFANGGSEVPGSGNSFMVNVSKTLALTRNTPFVSSGEFMTFVSSQQVRPDMGSIIRRKPRLNAPIA